MTKSAFLGQNSGEDMEGLANFGGSGWRSPFVPPPLGETLENILKYHNQDRNYETHMEQMNTYLVNESNECTTEDEVGHCYSFSNCLLDPNSRRFTIVRRILGFILKFIKNLKRRSRKLPSGDQYKSETKNILLTDEENEASQTYFFQKEIIEVKKVCQNNPVSADIHRKEWDITLQWKNFAN